MTFTADFTDAETTQPLRFRHTNDTFTFSGFRWSRQVLDYGQGQRLRQSAALTPGHFREDRTPPTRVKQLPQEDERHHPGEQPAGKAAPRAVPRRRRRRV